MSHSLTKFEITDDAPALPCWNIAKISIDPNAAQYVLGTPRYVETNSLATAGGTEDHWAFLSFDEIPVFFRLRVPYNSLDICLTDKSISSRDTNWLAGLFRDHTIEYYAEPWDENRHPNDGG